MEKLLPQNIEAECGVLGSIIIDPEAIVQVADFLHSDDFYRDAHRIIYEVIIQLYEQHEPADFITICDVLERTNRLEQIGGASYITSLINQVPTSGNVEYYGHIVARTALSRRLIHAAGQIAAIAYEEPDSAIALDKAEQLIFKLSQGHSRADFSALRDVLGDYMVKLEQLNERRGSIIGVPTGFTDLDRLTGGLQGSDLIILAARPAVGKCVTARTLIDDPLTGERLTIEECVQRRLSHVHGLSEDWTIHATAIGDWIDSGIQPCYRVQTQLGRTIEVTGHHPFLTVQGWQPLHDLCVGQHIAVPTNVPAFGTDESWSLDLVRLLAYFIAEGGLTNISPMFTNTDPVIIEDLGKLAKDKSFPACVWKWSRRYLAEFLRTLMSCNGSIYEHTNSAPIIEFCVDSSVLASDLYHALLRFGIIARFYQKTPQAWSVQITNPESVKRYQDEIGWIGEKAQYFAEYTDTHVTAFADALDNPVLHRIASPDIYWDKIITIEAIGEHQVYDLTVPDGANFIAQDIFVHNTSFALSLAHNSASKHQRSVAVFSLEMSKEQLAQRILSMDAGIDQQRLRTGWIEDDEWERIVFSMEKLSEANIWIDDTPGISTLEMRSKARRLHAEHGIDLIVVDYLQLMQSEIGGKRNENRVQEVSEISRNLKGLARELNVPILALAQLSRTVESRQSKVPQLSDLRESGCLAGETPVYLPDEGISRPIAELVGKTGFRVLSLNTETWQLEPCPVTNAFATGRKPVFKMTTRLGRSIRATANHKFLTINGWKRLDELAKDEHIAVPRCLRGPMQATMSDDELALLGHLIGDGCTLPNHATQYTTVDQDLAELVCNLASKTFGDRIAPRVQRDEPKGRNGGWYQVFLPPTFQLTHKVYNPVAQWLREMDAYGYRSYEKSVPLRVFAQPKEGIAVFLRHLWSTDGHASCSSNTAYRSIPRIFYATSSPRLATDVQSLLLRLDINARVLRVPQGGKGRDQYHVALSGKPDLERFITDVGIVGKRKQQMLEEVRVHIERRTTNTNRDVIPSLVWRQIVVPAMTTIGMTSRQMQAAIGSAYSGTGLYKNSLGRERALRVATAVQSQHLQQLAQSDVYWDKIVSIESDGEDDVYDITVDYTHSFTANNIIVHNSIEQDADIVMFIYRDEVYNPETERKNIADIIVAKHRNGPVGEVSLFFQPSQTRFSDLEVSSPAEEE